MFYEHLLQCNGDAGMALLRFWTDRKFKHRITTTGPKVLVPYKQRWLNAKLGTGPVYGPSSRTYHCVACGEYVDSEFANGQRMSWDGGCRRSREAIAAHLAACPVWDSIDAIASRLLVLETESSIFFDWTVVLENFHKPEKVNPPPPRAPKRL